DLSEQLLEQLAGLTDEGQTLLVLVEARRLADEHQVGMRIAGAEHDLRAALRQTAARASRDGLGICLQLVDVLDRYGAHGREDYAYLRMERIRARQAPRGASTSTSSPSALPKRARPTGDSAETPPPQQTTTVLAPPRHA